MREFADFIAGFIAGGIAFLLIAFFVRRRVGRRSPSLLRELEGFLGRDLNRFPVVTRSFSTADLPNLHLAIAWEVEDRKSSLRLLGFTSPQGEFQNSLRDLISPRPFYTSAVLGPVQYRQVDIDVDRQLQCVQNGLHLITLPDRKLVAYVRTNELRGGGLELEVLSESREACADFIEAVLAQVRKNNVYRAKVISLECSAQSFPSFLLSLSPSSVVLDRG